MRSTLAIVLGLGLSLSFFAVGCGGDDDGEPKSVCESVVQAYADCGMAGNKSCDTFDAAGCTDADLDKLSAFMTCFADAAVCSGGTYDAASGGASYGSCASHLTDISAGCGAAAQPSK